MIFNKTKRQSCSICKEDHWKRDCPCSSIAKAWKVSSSRVDSKANTSNNFYWTPLGHYENDSYNGYIGVLNEFLTLFHWLTISTPSVMINVAQISKTLRSCLEVILLW